MDFIKQSVVIEKAWSWIESDGNRAAMDDASAVAKLVHEFAPQDHEMISAAMLYTYHQRAPLSLDHNLEEIFGEVVYRLIQGTVEMTALHSHLYNIEMQQESQHENLRKMLLAMAEDVRVVVIKLAEHLNLMSNSGSLSEEQQIENAMLTRNVLAPLANRLGMGAMKWQLEDLAFRKLEPDAYQRLSRQIDQKRVERDTYINHSITAIENALKNESIKGSVTGRTKHLYSIWKKMQRKSVEVDSLYDLHAVRILVDTVSDCYAALGVVHGLWSHISREFDDYIANPKGNNYRSIHTAVHGPQRRILEIQIRTHEMHDAAELGVAAHWRYKEGTRYDPGFEKKIHWLRQLLEWKDEVSEQEGMAEQFRDEMVEEHIYVLTPEGEVIELPEGGTALDFAYTIHSGLGHRTRGAKVDGKIVPLNHPLESGQRVEILTVKEGGPTRDWMNPNLGYLHTSRARYRVRQWFRKQDFEENVAAGRAILEREMVRAGQPDLAIKKLVERYEQKSPESLYGAIGQGDITCGQIAGAISSLTSVYSKKRKVKKHSEPDAIDSNQISIRGVGKLMTSIANCCHPVDPDPVIGFITRGRGVTIHHQECPNALHLIETEPERVIEVSWGAVDAGESEYKIIIKAYDRSGLLSDITTLFRNEGGNIDSINTSTDRDNHTAHITLTVGLKSKDRFSKILDKLARVRNVISAVRDNG